MDLISTMLEGTQDALNRSPEARRLSDRICAVLRRNGMVIMDAPDSNLDRNRRLEIGLSIEIDGEAITKVRTPQFGWQMQGTPEGGWEAFWPRLEAQLEADIQRTRPQHSEATVHIVSASMSERVQWLPAYRHPDSALGF